MSGLVALAGGSEHSAGCRTADRLLLRQSGALRPHVAVLLAASPARRREFKRVEAEQWWASLGARARCAFAGEADPLDRAADLLRVADLVVLTGGRPWLLRRRLVDTVLGDLVQTCSRAGVPVAGSSAGAMMLAAHHWSLGPTAPLALVPGLGLAPGTLVAPHAGRHGVDRSARLTQALNPEVDVLGIPDHTTVVVRTDGTSEVVGERPIRTYRDRRSALAGRRSTEAPVVVLEPLDGAG